MSCQLWRLYVSYLSDALTMTRMMATYGRLVALLLLPTDVLVYVGCNLSLSEV